MRQSQIEDRQHVVGTEVECLLELHDRVGKVFRAVIIQSQQIVDRHGVLFRRQRDLQPVNGLLEPAMLAILERFAYRLVHLDAILRVRQFAVADRGILAGGKRRVPQCPQPIGKFRVERRLLRHLMLRVYCRITPASRPRSSANDIRGDEGRGG